MTKRSDLEVPGTPLNVSPRQWAIPYNGGAFIPGYGRTSRNTFDGLTDKKRQQLASQIRVDLPTLKELVDDAGVIVSVWILAPTEQDIYSERRHQDFINACLKFLQHVHDLSDRGRERTRSAKTRAEDNRAELQSMRMREELSPLMKLINPAWHDTDGWDVRPALKMARSLSDKLPQGEDAAGDDRDRLAADCLVASWFAHTKRRPSAGEKRESSPYRFYLKLFGDGSDANPSLSVDLPQGLIAQEREAFGSNQIQDFLRVVIRERALRRAIQNWLKDAKIRRLSN